MIPPIGSIGGGLSLAALEGVGQGGQAAGAGGAGAAAGTGRGGSGFGGALTEAIDSLEQSQDSASSASEALATGTVADPESAVVTVQDAQLAMELAAQIRTKATEAVQSVFNTQV
ncbi:MAG TPA: flagellar hook-basal body complex protein FliE [Solirubrobacteraceae bacterium]|nr:flagellar hook-basal body complex protein FliE [Solirubrobacteraceae bacterium]